MKMHETMGQEHNVSERHNPIETCCDQLKKLSRDCRDAICIINDCAFSIMDDGDCHEMDCCLFCGRKIALRNRYEDVLQWGEENKLRRLPARRCR